MIRRLWRLRPWRPRWEVVIIGRESGSVTPLPFLRFRRITDADEWVKAANNRDNSDSTVYALRRIHEEES